MDLDLLRYLTIALTLTAAAVLPAAIMRRHRPPRVLLLIVVLELQFIGATLAVADSIGEQLVWYRTPRILAAALIALTYTALAFAEQRRVRP